MKKFLIVLIGLLLIGILSFFCFQDKAVGIKEDLELKIKSVYASKQMHWVKADLKGNGLETTRVVRLEGVAPSEALKKEAERIALSQVGVGGVENHMIVSKAPNSTNVPPVSPTEIDSKVEARMVAKVEIERKPEPIPIIDVEVVSKPDPIPIIDVVPPKVVKKDVQKTTNLCQENLQKVLLDKKINFAYNKATITPDSYEFLNTLVEVAKGCPKEAILIGGHTDSTGDSAYNQKLSTLRANSVKKYLEKQRIATTRLYAIGYGASKPIADNKTKEGQAKNRRIELTIVALKDIPKEISVVEKSDLKSLNFDDIPLAKTTLIDSATAKNFEALQLGSDVLNVPSDRSKVKPVEKELPSVIGSCRKEFQALLSQNKIEFKYNKAKIKTSSYTLLNDLTKTAKKCSDMMITISGHTDSDGSESFNKRLSSKRAASVKDYLVEKGVNSERIKSIGYGASQPIADNSTPEGKSKNRRIEFNVKGVKQ